MSQTDGGHVLSSDKPQSDPADDRLGYAPFARHLANAIDTMVPSAGLVMAVYGAWGLGKSTLVNFVRHYLDNLPEADRPIVVLFNPWWFSGSEDLTRHFFDQLRAALNDKPFISKAVREGIADLAEAVSKVPSILLGAPVPLGPLGAVGKWIRPKQVDIVKVKERVASLLSKQSHKIIIVLDDIDRLTADETRQIFRLIKSVADFPNTIYLLAFDRSVVARMLEKSAEASGDTYLEKIIQVSFELPVPPRDLITRLLTEQIDRIIVRTPDDLFDNSRWREVFLSGVNHFINTPRDAVRLANTLSVTYPAVDGEVNIVDFIAIEALRTFRPEVYRAIRSRPESFTSDVPGDWFSSLGYDPAMAQAFHDTWLQEVPAADRQVVQAIVKQLFPKVASVWAGSSSGSGLLPEWRRDRRACSPDAFPAYFRLELLQGTVSSSEMRAILGLTSDAFGLALRLAELTRLRETGGGTRARQVLARLADHADRDIPTDAVGATIFGLLDVGDIVVSAEEEPGKFGLGSDDYINQIVKDLLRRMDPPKRIDVLAGAVSSGAAISTMVAMTFELGLEHGKYGRRVMETETRWLLTAEELQHLESLTLDKIRQAARDDTLAEVPRLANVRYRWRDWGGDAETHEWVQKLAETDAGLLRILQVFLNRSTGTQGIRFFFDPRSVLPFVDPDSIVQRVRDLSSRPDLTELHGTAIQAFIDGYSGWKQGHDPILG